MMTKQAIQGYVKAEPFRPFRLHLASGRTFDIGHPEMIKLLQNYLVVFRPTGNSDGFSDEWDSVSLMLLESVSHLEATVH